MKRLIIYVGSVLARINIANIGKYLLSVRNLIYTGYIGKGFSKIGRETVFYWRAYNIVGMEYIYIGNNNIFEKEIQLTVRNIGKTKPEIRIGNNCLIRAYTHITATNSIQIGDNLLTGTNVLITDNMHGDTNQMTMMIPPRDRPVVSKGNVIIGNNVWLGNNVCIMPGVIIGDGVVIGANSIVTHNIPAYCVAGGVPAKVLRNNILM